MGTLEEPRIAWAFCAVLLAAAALFYGLVPLTSDVSYFVMAASRLLAGERPYVDILETNPPLAFWVSLPPVALAEAVGASPHVFYVLYVCGLIGLALAAVWRLGRGRSDRGLTVVALAAALVLSPGAGFGQREHFATLLLAPYLASLMWRAEGVEVPRRGAAATGLAAGLGLWFKPLFLLFPLAAEAWLLWRRRRPRAVFRVQTMAMAVPVALFPAVVWLAAPEYYTLVVPLALETYGAYQRPLIEVATAAGVQSFAMILLLALLLWRSARTPADGLWIAMAAVGLAVYLIQAKGWAYQLVPGMGFATVALLRLAGQAQPSLLKRVAVAVAAVAFLSNALAFLHVQRVLLANYDGVFEGRPLPKVLLAMTYDNGMMFPFAQERGIAWGSSYPALWMLPSVAKGEVTGAAAEAVVGFAARRVAADLQRFKPDQVFIDARADTATLRGHRVDYLALFAPHGEFQAAWRAYRLARDGGTFQIWERQAE
jgi:hypothetical protein